MAVVFGITAGVDYKHNVVIHHYDGCTRSMRSFLGANHKKDIHIRIIELKHRLDWTVTAYLYGTTYIRIFYPYMGSKYIS